MLCPWPAAAFLLCSLQMSGLWFSQVVEQEPLASAPICTFYRGVTLLSLRVCILSICPSLILTLHEYPTSSSPCITHFLFSVCLLLFNAYAFPWITYSTGIPLRVSDWSRRFAELYPTIDYAVLAMESLYQDYINPPPTPISLFCMPQTLTECPCHLWKIAMVQSTCSRPLPVRGPPVLCVWSGLGAHRKVFWSLP